MEMKKYHKIVRDSNKGAIGVLEKGDIIVVQEKIDGANASFRKHQDLLKCFSRNNELGTENTLRGFYGWVQDNINTSILLDDRIYFGEWNVPHTIKYPQETLHKFYLFDVYNVKEERYENYEFVKTEAERLNLNLVPLFYIGEFKDYEQLKEMVGKTELGGEIGEGIVVKNQTRRDNRGNQTYIKLKIDKMDKGKNKKTKLTYNPTKEFEFIINYLSKETVEKVLHKLVDENIVSENFDRTDMRVILKHAGNIIYEDLITEEELPVEFEEKGLRRAIGKKLPSVVIRIIDTRK